MTQPLFTIPVPSSRATVDTGYDYVLPDQNGWSRSLHFQVAWVVGLTGVLYVISSWRSRHLRNNLFPAPAERNWRTLRGVMAKHLRFAKPEDAEAFSYNALQKLSYLVVIFILFPLVIWTGLAMSPAFNSAIPATVNLLGGRQSARTLHFFVSVLLLLFFAVHVAMVILAGFRSRMQAMITGGVRAGFAGMERP